MKIILKLEEWILFGFGIYLFSLLSLPWWWFLVFLLAPDVGMIGYLRGNKLGAFTYNLLHHKGIAIMLYLLGLYSDLYWLQLMGIIIFSHACMDRALGYGMKYEKGFRYTHLGQIGKQSG